jgi:predicted RNase H-like HicB family nuclease
MKVRDIIKLIEADGWYRIKAKGGHRQYKHPMKPWPGHRSWSDEGRPGQENRKEHFEARWSARLDRQGSEAGMDTYLVVIGRTATGYSAHCPEVLGCAAVGKTVEQVLANMKKALEFHFEGMMEDGEPIPRPGGVNSYRAVMKGLDVKHYLLGHVQIDTSRFAVGVGH